MAYIFFDLDGTLTNSEAGILNALKYALEKLDLKIPEDATLRKMIGPPLAESFTKILALPEEKIPEAIAFYREYFATSGLFENELYEGIVDLLEALQIKKHYLAVATGKPEPFALQILAHFDLSSYFDDVVGATLDGKLSKKTDILEIALKNSGVHKDSAIMIGDRKYDILAAHACGIKSIGVTWGFGSIEELKSANADEIIHFPDELLLLLHRKYSDLSIKKEEICQKHTV
ncbi:MAG: HAD hydrolase-like protein [Streptococcaceae bacterium]|jgi:phosphoglycolate phosphatase|nr:HAD hydrolase-like protein [Streptococcaceae bacterium]